MNGSAERVAAAPGCRGVPPEKRPRSSGVEPRRFRTAAAAGCARLRTEGREPPCPDREARRGPTAIGVGAPRRSSAAAEARRVPPGGVGGEGFAPSAAGGRPSGRPACGALPHPAKTVLRPDLGLGVPPTGNPRPRERRWEVRREIRRASVYAAPFAAARPPSPEGRAAAQRSATAFISVGDRRGEAAVRSPPEAVPYRTPTPVGWLKKPRRMGEHHRRNSAKSPCALGRKGTS